MFWEKFYNLCLSHGIKPNPVAEQIGISSGLITKWKHGATPNTDALLKIADYFNVSVDYLLGRTDAGTEINSNNTITGNYNVFGNNNSQISIKDELSSQEQELIARFRELSELDKAKTLLNIAEMCEKR